MRWSQSLGIVTADTLRSVAADRPVLNDKLRPEPELLEVIEVQEQQAAALVAAEALVGAVGDGPVVVLFHGQANPDYVQPDDGTPNDFVTVSVSSATDQVQP